jgi:DNA-directed RNA polymerase specialized sigma subunit
MEELQNFLKMVYEKAQYDTLIGILKILYNCCGLLIPDDLQIIFDCAEKELILIECMLNAIGQLNKSEQTLIQLLFFNELTTREAAKVLQVDHSTIVRRKSDLLIKIKKMMGF